MRFARQEVEKERSTAASWASLPMSLYCASRLFASRKSPSLLIRSAGGRELSEAYFFPGISISGPPLRWGRPFCNCDRVEKRLCSKSNTCIHIKRPISYHLSYHDFGHVWTNIKLTTSQFADKKTLVDVSTATWRYGHIFAIISWKRFSRNGSETCTWSIIISFPTIMTICIIIINIISVTITSKSSSASLSASMLFVINSSINSSDSWVGLVLDSPLLRD